MAPSSLAPVSFVLFIFAARKFTPLRSSPERSSPLRLLPERSAPPREACKLASTSARVVSAKLNAGVDRSTWRIMSCAVEGEAKRFAAVKHIRHRPRLSTWLAPFNSRNSFVRVRTTRVEQAAFDRRTPYIHAVEL